MRIARSLLIAVTLAGLLVLGSGRGGQAAGLSVEFHQAPISEALAKIAELAGRKLEIVGTVKNDDRVSLSIRNATLQDSFEKVLQTRSYVIVLFPDKRVTIEFLKSKGDAAIQQTITVGASSEELLSLFPDSAMAIPPDRPGGTGFTIADLDYYGSFAADVDRDEMPVFPPLSPEGNDITLGDLKRLDAVREVFRPADSTFFPPMSGDGPGVTQDDIERATADSPRLSPSQMEVIPPARPGEKGITLQQVEDAISRQRRTPSSPAAQFPCVSSGDDMDCP